MPHQDMVETSTTENEWEKTRKGRRSSGHMRGTRDMHHGVFGGNALQAGLETDAVFGPNRDLPQVTSEMMGGGGSCKFTICMIIS